MTTDTTPGDLTRGRPRITRLLRWVAVAAVGLALSVPLLLPLTGHRLLVVDGGSMEPTFPRGAVVLTAPATGDDLHPGRIVVVGASAGRYTHRVIGLDSTGTRARLQGDANAVPDPGWVSQRDVSAVPLAHVGGLTALLVRAATSLPGRLLMLAVLLGLVATGPPSRGARPHSVTATRRASRC
jgi:signal peptidase